MPIKRPDIYEHNNPNDAFVDSDFVRGGIRTTANTINDLYALSGKTDQLKVYATKVYVVNEDGYYILKDINNVDNVNGWIREDILILSNINEFSATTISATTYLGLPIDIRVTGGTYNAGTATFTNNTGGTFTVSGFSDAQTFTGGTVIGFTNFLNGLSALTVSATTYYGDGSNLTGISTQDTFVTGGTHNKNSGVSTFTNNTGGTFNVNGYFTPSDDIFTTGLTFNNATYDLNIVRNDGNILSANLGILASDMTITGGTYNPNTGVATFTNNTGGTFSVSGFLTGQTDTYVTGLTFTNNVLTLKQTNNQADVNVLINNLSGLTVNGSLSATTYLGLPLDVRVTGGTYSNGVTTFTNNTGGTFNVVGYYTGYTLTSSEIILALGYTPLSAYTDTFVTGGTYNAGTATFTNNTGGTFSITGFSTGSSTTFTGGTVSGATIFTNGLSANTFSASTYLGLPKDVFVTGGTYNAGTATFTNNTGGTFSVVGFSTGGGEFSGGTVTGPTIFVNGLSANTFSASTYLGLPLDIRVTGGTYSVLTGIATFVNNTGGTFSVSGFSTGYTLTSSGITNALGYTPLSAYTDVYVTGATYDSITNFTTFTNNTGGTFSVVGPDLTIYVPYSGAIDNVILDKQQFIVNTVNDAIAFQVNALADTTPRVDVGIGSAGHGFINLFDKDNNLVTNIENGIITANSFVVNGGTSNQILLADGTLGNFPSDVFVTGGTYNAGTATFTNNTGGTFSVSGFISADTYVTGYTYNDANQFTIRQNNGQPNLNATINIVTGLTTNYFDFNTGATVTGQVARLKWNDTDGTLDLGLKGGNVTLQIGQEQVVRVVNKTGSNLLESNYQAVRINGAQGNRVRIALAQANNDANSAETIGLVTENIDNNQEGFITTMGLVRGINTTGSLQGETWADGDMLYLSPTTAGRITNIKPVAPQHTVIIGYVVQSNPSNGSIFVKVDNGYELDELHNVNVTGATNGQVLTYSASTGLWVPTTVSASGTFTGGTVTGPTTFTNGLSANTISATTYQNLPPDVFVTGGTYNSGTTTLSLVNNTGGTFNVTGFTSGGGGGGGNSIGQLTGDVTAGPATASSQSVAATVKQNLKTGAFGITIDGLGGVISSGQKGYVYVPYDGIITGWSIFSDVVGSCVVDVWKDTYGNFPPTSGDSIAGNEKPTLTSQISNRDLTLSSWTTTISSGDVIGFNVEASPTGVTRVNLIINVTKT